MLKRNATEALSVSVFNLAWGPLAWVVATELAAGKNRTKIMGVATAAFWVSAWAVTFTLPYLYNDEKGSAGLGPMIGFICKQILTWALSLD